MVTQFYPPVVGGQEQHVRNLAQALAGRGHVVEVVTIAVDGREGTVLDGPVPVHHVHTVAQHLPSLYSDLGRPHAVPTVDPQLRAGIRRILDAGSFDVIHAHDWSVNSAVGPARRSRTPLVLTQHEYSHVCATKRMMRHGEVCPGPTLLACLRCASAQHGSIVGPAVVFANRGASGMRRRHIDTFVPVSSEVAVRTDLPGRSRYEIIPNFIPDDLLLDEAVPHPDGPIVFVGDLSRDKGIEVLIDAYRRLDHCPRLLLAGRMLVDPPARPPQSGRMARRPRPRRRHGPGSIGERRCRPFHRSGLLSDSGSRVHGRRTTGRCRCQRRHRGPCPGWSHRHARTAGRRCRTGHSALVSARRSRYRRTHGTARALDRSRVFAASAVVQRIESLYERLIAGG